MTAATWINFIAIVEFAALVTIALAVLLTRSARRRKRDTSATEQLVEKVRASQVERRDELKKVLESGYGYSGEELEEKTKRLMDVEKHFYERFITTYLNRDSGAVKEMDEHLKAVIRPYVEMKPSLPEPVEETIGDEESADVSRLREKLQRLSEDVTVYRDTLNRVFSEYTAMFGVHLNPKQQLSAEEIIGRLESGQLAGDDERTAEQAKEPAESVAAETPEPKP